MGSRPSLLEKFGSDLKPGDLVIDVGAFVGEEAVWCGKRGIRCVSYEPHPKWFAEMALAVQPSWPVELHEKAVMDYTGTCRLWNGLQYDDGASVLEDKENVSVITYFDVPCIDIAEVVGGRDVALLKVDAEGVEWRLFQRILDTCGFGRIRRVMAEDHFGKVWDSAWECERMTVKKNLEAAGIIVEDWI